MHSCGDLGRTVSRRTTIVLSCGHGWDTTDRGFRGRVPPSRAPDHACACGGMHTAPHERTVAVVGRLCGAWLTPGLRIGCHPTTTVASSDFATQVRARSHGRLRAQFRGHDACAHCSRGVCVIYAHPNRRLHPCDVRQRAVQVERQLLQLCVVARVFRSPRRSPAPHRTAWPHVSVT